MKWNQLFVMMFFWIQIVAAQTQPKPNDFAFGITLELEAGGSIYEVKLPHEVYEGVTRADLGDLRVFNGAGEVVPYLARSLPAKTDSAKTRVPLPLFPLYGSDSESLDRVSLKVRRDAAGTIVDVQTRDAQSENRRLITYLLDAGRIERPIDALVVSFGSKPQNQIWKIAVTCSDDLENWRPLVISAPIADLMYGGFALRQNRIVLPATKAKYFRISWARSEDAPVLETIAAESATATVSPPREWLTLSASGKKSESGEYFFTSTGYMPVDRLRVTLPQKNTVAQSTFWSRNDDDDEWRHRSSALIYHQQIEGEDIANLEVAISPVADRQWRMQVEQSGGGLGEGLLQLEIGWAPQQLLFVARGEEPFTLAYGNARIEVNEKSPEILNALQQEDKLTIKSAQTGAPVSLGGESRLRPPALGSNPKNWILWGVLILGVLMLGGMAVRLFRQMNRETA